MTHEKIRTSELFRCNDCGKEFEELEYGKIKAYQHAKLTKHRVTGEVVYAYHYNF